MQRTWTLALILLVVGVVGCSAKETSNQPTVTSTPKATPVAPAVPAYQLSENSRKLTALVKTDDTEQLRLVYREISGNVLATHPEGGYFLYLDCAFGNDPSKAANRLATAKIAVGKLGAAQTGTRIRARLVPEPCRRH